MTRARGIPTDSTRDQTARVDNKQARYVISVVSGVGFGSVGLDEEETETYASRQYLRVDCLGV
jgi:hypothetical protein